MGMTMRMGMQTQLMGATGSVKPMYHQHMMEIPLDYDNARNTSSKNFPKRKHSDATVIKIQTPLKK
jgi:hypothetical protein